MIVEIGARNVPRAYREALWKMRVFGTRLPSRGGEVISIPHPVLLEMTHPWERVLFDPIRDANPFFHVMEFVWMIAGSNDARWIAQFNKGILNYADDDILRGAYGWRWANPHDQLSSVISLLRNDPDTRQAVLSMWDVTYDNATARTSDRPCNTHIYFRVRSGYLDITICNRSNDLIWGMLGANTVHMTLLHELISRATGYEQGLYRVFSNNVHAYTGMSRFNEIYNSSVIHDPYPRFKEHYPLLSQGETWESFREDCKNLVKGVTGASVLRTQWMKNVAYQMHEAYTNKAWREKHISEIRALDWKLACEEWSYRRKKNYGENP